MATGVKMVPAIRAGPASLGYPESKENFRKPLGCFITPLMLANAKSQDWDSYEQNSCYRVGSNLSYAGF